MLLTIYDAPAWAEGPGRPPSAAAGHLEAEPLRRSPTSCRRSRRATREASTRTAPARRRRSLRCRRSRSGTSPTYPGSSTPQYEGKTAFSPGHYREMLNAAYAAVKAVDPQMLVVTAGTAPYGDPPGGNRVRPVEFWRQVLCVTAGKKKKKKKRRGAKRASPRPPAARRSSTFSPTTRSTPGGRGPARRAINPDDASSADLDRIVRVLRGAERAGTVLPGRHPLWATEMWWDSNPPTSPGRPLVARRVGSRRRSTWRGRTARAWSSIS